MFIFTNSQEMVIYPFYLWNCRIKMQVITFENHFTFRSLRESRNIDVFFSLRTVNSFMSNIYLCFPYSKCKLNFLLKIDRCTLELSFFLVAAAKEKFSLRVQPGGERRPNWSETLCVSLAVICDSSVVKPLEKKVGYHILEKGKRWRGASWRCCSLTCVDKYDTITVFSMRWSYLLKNLFFKTRHFICRLTSNIMLNSVVFLFIYFFFAYNQLSFSSCFLLFANVCPAHSMLLSKCLNVKAVEGLDKMSSGGVAPGGDCWRWAANSNFNSLALWSSPGCVTKGIRRKTNMPNLSPWRPMKEGAAKINLLL